MRGWDNVIWQHMLLKIARTPLLSGLRVRTLTINICDVLPPHLEHVRARNPLPPVKQTLSKHDVIWQRTVTIYSDYIWARTLPPLVNQTLSSHDVICQHLTKSSDDIYPRACLGKTCHHPYSNKFGNVPPPPLFNLTLLDMTSFGNTCY